MRVYLDLEALGALDRVYADAGGRLHALARQADRLVPAHALHALDTYGIPSRHISVSAGELEQRSHAAAASVVASSAALAAHIRRAALLAGEQGPNSAMSVRVPPWTLWLGRLAGMTFRGRRGLTGRLWPPRWDFRGVLIRELSRRNPIAPRWPNTTPIPGPVFRDQAVRVIAGAREHLRRDGRQWTFSIQGLARMLAVDLLRDVYRDVRGPAAEEVSYERLRSLGSAAEVGAVWASLSYEDKRQLLSRHGADVAMIDGVPLEGDGGVYDINRRRVFDEWVETTGELYRELERSRKKNVFQKALDFSSDPVTKSRFEALEARRASLEKMVSRKGNYLAFDSSGRGRVIQVFGDLERAQNVAVVVPGTRNTLDNYSNLHGDARRLHKATTGESTATIAWLGYDTPDLTTMMSRDAADRAAPALASFVNALDTPARRVTVTGHSYGAYVVGRAMLLEQGAMRPDAVVAAGGPGLGVGHTDEFGAADTEFYGVNAPWDPVSGTPSVFGSLGNVERTVRDAAGTPVGLFIPDLDHFGESVAQHNGFTMLSTEDTGHFAYYDKGSEQLNNIACVVEGRTGDVVPAGAR